MLLQIQKLRKEFGDTIALKNITFDIPQGAIFGLIGPNGAGKSTTFRMISGLLEPTSGKVDIEGIDVWKDPLAAFAQIGYLPDFYSLYEGLKVWEYLDYTANTFKIKRQEIPARIDYLLQQVNLMSKKDEYIFTLSRGMKQRVGIAKTLIHDPKLIILDEPAAGLDPLARKELISILVNLNRSGKTIIISSHILSELSEFCTHVGILEKGVLVKCGEINQIVDEDKFDKKIVIELMGTSDTLVKFISKLKYIKNIEAMPSRVSFDLAGDDKTVVQLHKFLISKDFPMLSFINKRKDISDIFMEVSTNEVS
jgi:ABC-2 type transport system ATP-binding protein